MKHSQILFLSLLAFTGIAPAAQSSTGTQSKEKSVYTDFKTLGKLPEDQVENFFAEMLNTYIANNKINVLDQELSVAIICYIPEDKQVHIAQKILDAYLADHRIHKIKSVYLIMWCLSSDKEKSYATKILNAYEQSNTLHELHWDSPDIIDCMPGNERGPFVEKMLYTYLENGKIHELQDIASKLIYRLPQDKRAFFAEQLLNVYLIEGNKLHNLNNSVFYLIPYLPEDQWAFFIEKLFTLYVPNPNNKTYNFGSDVYDAIEKSPLPQSETREFLAETILNTCLATNKFHNIGGNIGTIITSFLPRDKQISFVENALNMYLKNNQFYELKTIAYDLIWLLPEEKRKLFAKKVVYAYFYKNKLHELAGVSSIINNCLSEEDKTTFTSQPGYKTQECMLKIYEFLQKRTPEYITSELIEPLTLDDICSLIESAQTEGMTIEEYKPLCEKYFRKANLQLPRVLSMVQFNDLFASFFSVTHDAAGSTHVQIEAPQVGVLYRKNNLRKLVLRQQFNC